MSIDSNPHVNCVIICKIFLVRECVKKISLNGKPLTWTRNVPRFLKIVNFYRCHNSSPTENPIYMMQVSIRAGRL